MVLGGFGWFRVLVTATDRALIGMHKIKLDNDGRRQF